MTARTVAFVGVAGGVGTTRLTVECGATLARAGRDVTIVETAFATQGLAAYVDEQVGADATALATGDADLGETLYDPYDLPGRLSLCPARAPFERVARAQTAAAARRLERQLAAAALSHDVALVDTPPVSGNQALAAVDAADRVVVVVPDDPRGPDALARMRERLRDIGASADAVLATRVTGDAIPDADAAVPESDVADPRDCPACASPDDTFAPAVLEATEAALGTDIDLDLDIESDSRLDGILGS
ncbi:MAG: AAA family ATPase [Halovenus sp.]